MPPIPHVCSSPATPTAPASLPAPADAGQGVGIPCDFLHGELSRPMGFWIVCCDDSFAAHLPSDRVRMERRA